jgi:hypothetical protein
VLKGGLILQMVGHHLLRRRARLAWSIVKLLVFIIVIAILLAHKVLGSFMLVCAAILQPVSFLPSQ